MTKKDVSWIKDSGLYGTWTFTTQTMTDVGYYKGIAYIVMHLMPDPMHVNSCVINSNSNSNKGNTACIEADNRACSHVGYDDEKEECVDTETSEVEWSDGTYNYGSHYCYMVLIIATSIAIATAILLLLLLLLIATTIYRH